MRTSNDVDPTHTGAVGLATCDQLGDHPRPGQAVRDGPLQHVHIHRWDGPTLRVQHAGSAAGDQESRGAQPRCEMPGQRIGVHVEQLPSVVGADAGHDRYETRLTEPVQQQGPVGASWLPDETQVDEGAVGRRVGLCPRDRRHTGVGSGQPDRLHPGDPGRGHELGVHTAREHADDNVEGGRVSHTEPIDRLLWDPLGGQFRVDLAPTAVHDDEGGP